jgi:sugar phosphate isomerase/epimerase
VTSASGPWRLAVHSALLRGLPPREAVALVSNTGYQGLFWELESDSIDRLTALHAPAGHMPLAVSGVGFGPDDRNPVEPDRAIEIARALGADCARVVGASMAGQTYAAAYDATVRLCEAYLHAARKHSVRVLLHQRWGTLAASASQIQRVLANFDPREVGCVYDAGSMTIEGYEEYRIGLEILGSYVADVHIANTRHFPPPPAPLAPPTSPTLSSTPGRGMVWEWEWSPLSDGLIDLLRLFHALRRAGYQGWITLADRSLGRAVADLLEVDRHILQQAMDDFEGVGAHNPCRPLDDHVDLAERPVRAASEALVGIGAHR